MHKPEIVLSLAIAALLGSFLSLTLPAEACSVTYTFTTAMIADPTQVNQNFSDVLGCMTNPTFAGNLTLSSGYITATNGGTAGIFTTTGSSNALNVHVPGTSASYIVFYYDGSGGGVAGQILPNSSTTVQYLTSSDERMKNFDVEQRDYRPIIEKLLVRDFKWRANGSAGFGVSAQQAYPLFPQAIHKPQDEKDNWQADYGQFAPLALWGVKDLYRITASQEIKFNQQQALANLQTETLAKLKRENDVQAAEIKLLSHRLLALERKANKRVASD
jgi:hypothetical protein